MNNKYTDAALLKIPCVELLINMVSQRVRQLHAGHRPLVEVDDGGMMPVEIALKEIAQGKAHAQSEEPAEPVKSEKKSKK